MKTDKFEIINIRPKDLDTFVCDIIVTRKVKVENPLDFKITVTELTYTILVKDETVRYLGFDGWEISYKRQTVNVTDEEIKKGEEGFKFTKDLFAKSTKNFLEVNDPIKRDVYGRLLGKPSITIDDQEVALIPLLRSKGYERHN